MKPFVLGLLGFFGRVCDNSSENVCQPGVCQPRVPSWSAYQLKYVATPTHQQVWNFLLTATTTTVTAIGSASGHTNTEGSYLVIPLAEKLQTLCSLVHEDPVQVTCLHRADLNGLLSPAHDLVGVDISCERNTNKYKSIIVSAQSSHDMFSSKFDKIDFFPVTRLHFKTQTKVLCCFPCRLCYKG